VTGESATLAGESTAAAVGGDDGLLEDAHTEFVMGLLWWSFPGRDSKSDCMSRPIRPVLTKTI